MKKIMIIIGFAMAMCFASDAVAQENSDNGEQGTAAVNCYCYIKTSTNNKISAYFKSDKNYSTDSGKVPADPGNFKLVQAPSIPGDNIIYQRCTVWSKKNENAVHLQRTYSYWKEYVDFTTPGEAIGTLPPPAGTY